MKVYVATKNEAKVNIVKEVISSLINNEEIEIIACEAKSDVSETPWNEETLNGAINRAKNAKKENPDGDLYIGIETGLTERFGFLFEETWCFAIYKNENEFLGYSSGNVISEKVLKRILKDEKTNAKILEIFDDDLKTWVKYSGDKTIREISIRNALTQVIFQILK
ncbi:MAG: inosine/xanthosine triphosphatase [Candidatus Aenigmatarchaeota archaeon]